MTRCKAITCTGKRCKKSGGDFDFCGTHTILECGLCKRENGIRERYRVKNCGHTFCTMCLVDDFYDFQWFDDFSTEHQIKCPECDISVCDTDWSFITNFLCECKVLQRKIVYHSYLCPSVYNELYERIVLGQEYDLEKMQIITRFSTWNRNSNLYTKRPPFNNNDPIIVYFEKFTGTFDCTYYRFFYIPQEIRNLFEPVQKELIEYVFHPSRINLETLEFI
jgi:hypothetical protein